MIFSNMELNKSPHEKIAHWKVRSSQDRLDILFPCWIETILSQENFEENETQVSFRSTISSDLELLHAKFVHYFSGKNIAQLEQKLGSITLIKRILVSLKCLLAANEASLIGLSCDENLQGKFSYSSLSIVWLNAAIVGYNCLKLLCQCCHHFEPHYPSEARFSALTAKKTKHRNILCRDMRLSHLF